MSDEHSHLSDLEINQILDSSMDLSSDWEQHLDSCNSCQDRLSTATADPWWWSEGRPLVTSSLRLIDDALPKFELENNRETESRNASEIETLITSFGKPIHPELLGTVDEYEIIELIGCGGMGAVFRGLDRKLNRSVALKFLLPCHSRDGLARQRFVREAKSVAAVRDDNVVPIFGINAAGEYPYFVMPFIPGVSLERYVKENGAIEATQLSQIATQIAAGLAAAHDQGIIHRDIKPANILLENDCNRVIVTDFGLAREVGDLSMTQTGLIAGTPKYMSPEQTGGKPLDHRSDLFSLGGVMYWMATGRSPFEGSNLFELFNHIRIRNPTRVRQWNAQIPVAIERAIEKLLEKDPSQRFGDARKLEDFLRKYSAYLQAPTAHREPKLRRKLRAPTWTNISIVTLVPLLITAAWISNTAYPPDTKKRSQVRAPQGPSSRFSGNPELDSKNKKTQKPVAANQSDPQQERQGKRGLSTDANVTAKTGQTNHTPADASGIGTLRIESEAPFLNGVIKVQSTEIPALHVELSITDQTKHLEAKLPVGEFEFQYVVDGEVCWKGTHVIRSGQTESVSIDLNNVLPKAPYRNQ